MRAFNIFLLLPIISFCTEKGSEEDSIGFIILEKAIHVQVNKSSFEIPVVLSNSSQENFILYAFTRGFITTSEDSIFVNVLSQPGRSGAGNAMFVLDKYGNRQSLVIDDCDDCEEPDPISHRNDFLTILRDSTKRKYMETTEFLKAKSKRKTRIRIRLGNIKLSKGEYQFYMIYYAGSNLGEIIGEPTMKEDIIIHRGIVFKGWTKSNTIKLIVE